MRFKVLLAHCFGLSSEPYWRKVMAGKKRTTKDLARTQALIRAVCLITEIDKPYKALQCALQNDDYDNDLISSSGKGLVSSGQVSDWVNGKKVIETDKAQQIADGVLRNFGWESAKKLCIIYNHLIEDKQQSIAIPEASQDNCQNEGKVIDIELPKIPTKEEFLASAVDMLLEKGMKYEAGDELPEPNTTYLDWFIGENHQQQWSYQLGNVDSAKIVVHMNKVKNKKKGNPKGNPEKKKGSQPKL